MDYSYLNYSSPSPCGTQDPGHGTKIDSFFLDFCAINHGELIESM